MWTHNGERPIYQAWADGEPNYGLEELCVDFDGNYGNWRDNVCESSKAFICKTPISCKYYFLSIILLTGLLCTLRYFYNFLFLQLQSNTSINPLSIHCHQNQNQMLNKYHNTLQDMEVRQSFTTVPNIQMLFL